MAKKVVLYGTRSRSKEVEYKPVCRSCADCGVAEHSIWYEKVGSDWVCDPCMEKRWADRAERLKEEEDGDGH